MKVGEVRQQKAINEKFNTKALCDKSINGSESKAQPYDSAPLGKTRVSATSI